MIDDVTDGIQDMPDDETVEDVPAEDVPAPPLTTTPPPAATQTHSPAGMGWDWAMGKLRRAEKVARKVWPDDEWLEMINGKILDEDGDVFDDSSEQTKATDWMTVA